MFTRDESTTVNRQPEFTQLDIELSFTQPESIIELIENVLSNCWPSHLPIIQSKFERMTYKQAMETYGSDKPDIRSADFLVKKCVNRTLIEQISLIQFIFSVKKCHKFGEI